MSLIEGVGDEVTVGVSVFLVLCLILLAWFSTHTRDIPFVSIIVVELSQRRNRNRNGGESSTPEGATTEQGSGDGSQTESISTTNAQLVESIGANNNAETPSEDVTDFGPSGSSKNEVDNSGHVSSHCATDKDSKTVLTKERDKSEDTLVNKADDVTVSPQVAGNTVSSSPRDDGSNVASSSTSPQWEEAAAEVIPEFKGARETPDEVRRRRVAYFESSKDSQTVPCRGAESHQSSVGAQSLGDTNSFSGSIGAQSHQSSSDPDPGKAPLTPSSVSCVAAQPGKSTASENSGDTSDRPSVSPQSSLSTSTLVASPGDIASGRDVSESPLLPPSLMDSAPSPPPSFPRREGVASGSGMSDLGSEVRGQEESAENLGEEEDQQIRVRLKYLNDTQRLVYAHPTETVGNFRRLHFSSELEENKVVRFIFNGQDLRNDLSTLRAYNIADNSVVHCLITANRQREEGAHTPPGEEEEGGQMGEMIYPLFGLILGLVWYLRVTYKQYFNAVSTVSLAGVSFLYLLALFSSLRSRRHPHHPHQHPHLD